MRHLLNMMILSSAFVALVLFAGSVKADETSSITITVSRSTNMPGYKIEVMPDGLASYDNGFEKKQKTLPLALTKKLYASVKAMGAFAALKQGACMKSASFGTTTTISYNDVHSPDISCPGDQQATDFYGTIEEVEQRF